MSNVKLAIRVRPFTDKELKSVKERVPVVSVVDENTVTITNIKVSASGAGDSRERVRRFYADYTFDSACAPTHPNYASQEKVFDKLGRQVLSTISAGLSACVLTYGQSATGKTHTMMGTAAQPGLIPRICMALAGAGPFHITVSFLEIYNERVHDLLAGEVLPVNSLPRRKGNARKDLRVREHPTKGPYVQNLRRVTITDLESLLAVVTEGTRRRRTAATRRNTSSSRSHALLELVTPHCKLHLADLAGSEKSGWEGCSGRLKEGANINKSLVALTNVISALVSGGSGRGRFVPYRDSALTWLLKDCFTGGGSIFIIATVSPGVACYGESASTLRWAASARCLTINRPTVTPHVISKAVLQAQFNQLLSELANHFIKYKPDTGQLIYDDKHWELQINRKQSAVQEAKIGNIMNFRYPKSDARNSSTPSSIASGSSDIINNMDKNAKISNEINKEIDKLFGPALERTRSGSDIEVAAALKPRNKQFSSQEVLSNDKLLQPYQSNRLSDAEPDETPTDDNKEDKVPQVSILYDNQRAEIIASVTERLYSRLNKKNEDSVTDKKIELKAPLNELKICSNARQRLMEISKKALKNKRRIGIPAHTQTKRFVVRVKDQGIDIQTDLHAYVRHQNRLYIVQKDASTETTPMTPRLKDIAVGPDYSNLSFNDRATSTENKQLVYSNVSVMTGFVTKSEQCTQTCLKPLPPRRRKQKSIYTKYLKKIGSTKSNRDENNASPIININICPTIQSDSDSLSSPATPENTTEAEAEKQSVTTTPDLLTNHNNIVKHTEQIINRNDPIRQVETSAVVKNLDTTQNIKQEPTKLEFSDEEEVQLPRVTVDSNRKCGRKDYMDLIIGRNDKLFPYNLKLSPIKQRHEAKRVIRFKNDDVSIKTFSNEKGQRKENIRKPELNEKEYECSNESDSDSEVSETSKNNSFVWNKMNNTSGKDIYTHVLGEGYLLVDKPVEHGTKQKKRFVEVSEDSEGSCSCREPPQLDGQYWRNNRNGNDFKINKHKPYKFQGKLSEEISFENIEKNIERSCSSLESSVNRYDDYLQNYTDRNILYGYRRTPTEYLQHLIKLRKAAVKSDSLS